MTSHAKSIQVFAEKSGGYLKEDERDVADAAVESLSPRLDHGGKALHEGSGITGVALALVP